MSCCGQNRSSMNKAVAGSPVVNRSEQRLLARSVSATPSMPSGPGVSLRTLRSETFVVRGPRTGWRYEFSHSHPVQSVATQDAELLIATGMFKLERLG